MKHAIAGIYTNYTTSVHEHGDMELMDGFTAGPRGNRLHLKFYHI